MKRPTFLISIGLPIAVSLVVVWACTTGEQASPTGAPPAAAPPPPVDGGVDAHREPVDATAPSCTAVDIVPGTGKKFCELPGVDSTELQVPPEFCVREFTTTPIIETRVLRFAPNGDLFVAAPAQSTPGGATDGPGAILVLPDDDADGRADAVLTFAGGSPRTPGAACGALEVDPNNFACVHGLLFAGDYLYFTRSDEVRRFHYTAGARAAAGPSEVVAKLGGAAISDVRWTHTLEQTKDGDIYVSRGRFDSSACTTEEMSRGAVFSLHVEPDGGMPVKPTVVADGFRNPMYLRCSPASCGECYASELSGDGWDGVGGTEKLALLGKKGESWGYPCCVRRDVAAPGVGAQNCSGVGTELTSIPLHDTNFGLDFDRGGFPEPYKHGLFVALHGVSTSFGGTGVVWVKTDPRSLRPTSEVKMFVKGFGKPNGRATDVVFAPDGRLFVGDDTSGKIFWIAPRTLAAPK